MFPEQSGAFMNALLFGDRQQMTFEIEEQYQQFGLIHLLAISGSHIVLLMVIMYFVLLRSGVTKETATVLPYSLHSSVYVYSWGVAICCEGFYNRSFIIGSFHVLCSLI